MTKKGLKSPRFSIKGVLNQPEYVKEMLFGGTLSTYYRSDPAALRWLCCTTRGHSQTACSTARQSRCTRPAALDVWGSGPSAAGRARRAHHCSDQEKHVRKHRGTCEKGYMEFQKLAELS
jgi:hypothetical protein